MTNTLKGSCLCGQMQYEIKGEAKAFHHCHCQRCRKSNGTGHASNLRVADASLRWISGEKLLRSYKLPEAERFRNDFCGECGSPMPRLFTEHGFVVLPAGTLDCDLPAVSACRIFDRDRVEWSCRDELPAFDGYPN